MLSGLLGILFNKSKLIGVALLEFWCLYFSHAFSNLKRRNVEAGT